MYGRFQVAALLCVIGNAVAQANPWDTKVPVTIVIPYSPGGSTDAIGRVLAKSLTNALGQPVLIENVPGADGLIGTRRVMDAKADGNTLLLQVPAIVATKFLPNLKGIDPLTRLTPVASVAETPTLMVSSSKVPAKNLKEFFQYCKAAANSCNIATSETLGRVRAKRISVEADLPNVVVVNYRGTSPVINDMIGGLVDLTFAIIPAVLGHYKIGNVKILAVQDEKRSPTLPEVETTVEAGFPQFQSVTWFGLFAPRETPLVKLTAIANVLHSLRNNAELQKTVAAAGGTVVMNTPAEFSAQVRDEEGTWGALVRRFPIVQ